MAFKKERLSEDEQKKFRVIQAHVDREKNAFLIPEGSDAESNVRFSLFYKNEKIEITAKRTVGKESNFEWLEYKIRILRIPSSLQLYQRELIEMIKEALDKYGFAGEKVENTKTTIELPKKIIWR